MDNKKKKKKRDKKENRVVGRTKERDLPEKKGRQNKFRGGESIIELPSPRNKKHAPVNPKKQPTAPKAKSSSLSKKAASWPAIRWEAAGDQIKPPSQPPVVLHVLRTHVPLGSAPFPISVSRQRETTFFCSSPLPRAISSSRCIWCRALDCIFRPCRPIDWQMQGWLTVDADGWRLQSPL